MSSSPPAAAALPVEVRRSRRRTRTVSASERDGRLVVMIPDHFDAAQERLWVERMQQRLTRRRGSGSRAGDADLAARAQALSRRYLHGRAVPTSVSWVSNMRRRWGSCTPSTGAIRISDELKTMPDWVVDEVVLHELAHLIQPSHGPRFWALLADYPHHERARGYLEGYAAASGRQIEDDTPGDDP